MILTPLQPPSVYHNPSGDGVYTWCWWKKKNAKRVWSKKLRKTNAELHL